MVREGLQMKNLQSQVSGLLSHKDKSPQERAAFQICVERGQTGVVEYIWIETVKEKEDRLQEKKSSKTQSQCPCRPLPALGGGQGEKNKERKERKSRNLCFSEFLFIRRMSGQIILGLSIWVIWWIFTKNPLLHTRRWRAQNKEEKTWFLPSHRLIFRQWRFNKHRSWQRFP